MQTFTNNLHFRTSEKKQTGNQQQQQANSFVPNRKHSLIKLAPTISQNKDCTKNNFYRSFTAPNFNFSNLRSLSPLSLQPINYNHSNNHLKGEIPALYSKLINYNNAHNYTTLDLNQQQLEERDKTSFNEFKPIIKHIRKLTCLATCKLNLGSVESHSLPTHHYNNNKLTANREDCSKRSELDKDKLKELPKRKKLASFSFDQNSATRRISSDNNKAHKHTDFISIFKNNDDNLKSNCLHYNNTTKSNKKNNNNNNNKKSPNISEKDFERNKRSIGCAVITNQEKENFSKTIKPHLKGKRNTPTHRAITTTTTKTQNKEILINTEAYFSSSSSSSSLFWLHNKQTSIVRNSNKLKVNPSLRNHDRLIEALNSSMKRSKMNMNLAGIDPAESDEMANQDTISSSQHTTTTKTTKKSTKFIPISNNNFNQNEESVNSIPISNQISIQRNATSQNPNQIHTNSIRTESFRNNNENSNTITTEKSSNIEQKYEKQQRFVLEERDTNSNDLARINTLSIKTNTDNFKYIDDDDDYQCHDTFVDRIVPKSRVSNVDLRHELKESINHLDKLIDSASSTKIVYPRNTGRSSSAYQETKRSEVPAEVFHPTWDEWKRSQKKIVDNNSNDNNNNETNSFKKESKKQKTSNKSNEKATTSTTHRSVIEESYRQSTNNNKKQEYQIKESDYTENSHHNNNKPEENFETKQTHFKQTSSANLPISLQLKNLDTVNMRNQVKLNHNSIDDCIYHPPTPILINDGSQSAFPSFSNQRPRKQLTKQNSDDFESSSNGFSSSSKKKERKQNLTKRLEQILYSQLNENPIPITPITQAQTNIKQVLSKNYDSSSRNGFTSMTQVRSASQGGKSPTKSPVKNVSNTPKHPVYPIDRKPYRAASPVQFSTVVLAKELPKELPVVAAKVDPPQVQAPQPKKISKTILSTKKRKDSAPSLTGWRSDTDESDSLVQSQLVTKKTGAIPIEYISIRRDPKPVQKKENVKKSITTGTNTNTERGKKIASTNTNKDEIPQYNLHVSLDSLFVKSRREASTETETKNHNVATETITKHRDACTETDDEGEPPAPRIHEQYCYAHNSRFDQWETRSNPPEPQETIRLELLAKSPRTVHRKNVFVNSCYNSNEDLYNNNLVCQPIYTQPKQVCAVDDDDLLIFGNSSHQYIEDTHQSVTRRTGSIPNLCYVAPVVQAAPVRRYIKTTQCYGTPMASQTMLHTSNSNLSHDQSQINHIQSKFDEIFGIQRNNECYSTQSLGHFEAVPKVARYYKTTRTTNSQMPSFGEVYQQRHNEYLSSSHQRSGSSHHAQSQQQQQRVPIVEIPATPDSTMGRMSRQQHFSSSSASHMGQQQAGTNAYTSYSRKASNANESHIPMYTTLPNESIHIKATTVPVSQNGGYQNENMSSSHRSVRTNGGRYEEEELFSHSNQPDDSENRQFRPIFHPIITEQPSGTHKWPTSNKQV